ncbi:MAG: NADH/ubiquinone/plastoquinone (complex i) [Bacteroidetes bacterium]|nr:MAG: NADH/ubiquinone/plastoquinone (complex i) [Bacteroidota bacterium]
MTQNILVLLVLFSPLIFVLTAFSSWFQPGKRPLFIKKLSVSASLISLAIAAFGTVALLQYGEMETPTYGINGLGFSLRLDSLSLLMFSMIALLSFIVVRFSLNYLDGDARQGVFIGRLAATIAAVQLLVLAGNLALLFIAWVLTSMTLHRLLVFYRERPGARVAARKKFIVARLGDLSLLGAIVLLFEQFHSGNLELIFQGIKNAQESGLPLASIGTAGIFLALAALLKSAQFPTHGWLVEVMETPTPVSALLHAGLLNAGPFLIIRMAFVMEASTTGSMLLIAIGGFTALFASVVFLTQTSVKTALGYSSAAHMGFSLMVCGLGVFPAAMLHMVAHSFYKAHSFLATGSVIDSMRSAKFTGTIRSGNPLRIVLGILLGFGVYIAFALAWGVDPQTELPLLAIGAIISLGLARLFTSALDSNGSPKLFLRASLLSVMVAASFFILEAGAHLLLASQLPQLALPSLSEIILISILLSAFATVIFIQIMSPFLADKPAYRALAIHLRNGLYMNTLFDRLVRGLYTQGAHGQAKMHNSNGSFTNEESTRNPLFAKRSA